jgi:hypothetical protein
VYFYLSCKVIVTIEIMSFSRICYSFGMHNAYAMQMNWKLATPRDVGIFYKKIFSTFYMFILTKNAS